MAVPLLTFGVTVTCILAMPRTRMSRDIGSDVQTSPLSRFTAGIQAVGGIPVSASQPPETTAMPPLATVSKPPMNVRDQPSWRSVLIEPVPSYQRDPPSEKRRGVPVALTQSDPDSGAPPPRGQSWTPFSWSLPVFSPP